MGLDLEQEREGGEIAIIVEKVGISPGIVIKGRRGIEMIEEEGKIESAISAKSLDILQESVLCRNSN